jgi:type II secretion system protein N
MSARTRLLLGAGYLALFLVTFYVALILVFPVDALRRHLAAAVERETPLTLAIGELRVGWTGDLEARQVTLAWPGPDRSVPVLAADRVEVDVALSPLLFGRLDADFDGEAYDGRFDGHVEGPLSGGPADRLRLHLDRLDLARHAGLASAARLVATGRLSGDVSVSHRAPGGFRPGRRTGTVRLLAEAGSLRELPFVASSLPEVGIERASASARIDGDRLEVEEVDVRGPEVALTAAGHVGLVTPLGESTLNLTLRVRPERRMPPTVRQMLAAVSRPADASGTFGYLLLGTVTRPELRPL